MHGTPCSSTHGVSFSPSNIWSPPPSLCSARLTSQDYVKGLRGLSAGKAVHLSLGSSLRSQPSASPVPRPVTAHGGPPAVTLASIPFLSWVV